MEMMIKIFTVLVPLMFSGLIYAEPLAIQQLQQFLTKTQTLKAKFQQITLDENDQPIQTSYGDFYLSRPGKFRWNYQKPIAQEIISDGHKVWFYDADLEQVTIKNIDQSLGLTPALLLSGEVKLEQNFELQQQGDDGELQWLKLTPKQENSSYRYILIGLSQEGIEGMELSDHFAQLTRIYFSHIKKNQPLNDRLFQFKVPAGVDIFEN